MARLWTPLTGEQGAAVRAAYEAAPDPETRTRYQIVLLAAGGQAPAEIARATLRSRSTVARVLRRFARHGVAAVPYHKKPGKAKTVTPAWGAELLRVIDLPPRDVGVEAATWGTRLLADYLATATGVVVSLETVRRALHAAGYVCKRPTWSLKRRAEQAEGYAGNAPGWRRS